MAKAKKTNSPASISRVNRQITIGFVIVTMVLALIISYFSLSRATVYITPQTYSLETDTELEILPEVESTLTGSNILPGTISLKTESMSEIFTPQPETIVAEKASGSVTIYNNYSQNQTLVATTRLLSPDKKLFRTTETVVVPAGGQIVVQVEADQAGELYEIGPSRFTIPGLWEGLQDKIYGQSELPITRTVTTSGQVTLSNLENAKENLLNKIAEKIATESASQDNYVLTDTTLLNSSSSAGVGQETESFEFSVTAEVVTITTPRQDLIKVTTNNLKSSVSENQIFLSYNPESLTYNLIEYDTNIPSATINVYLQGLAAADIKSTLDKAEIAGFSRVDAIDYLTKKPGIEKVKVDFSPAWVK